MNAPSLTVLTLIQTVSERLDAAGLTPSDGFGHGTQTAFDEAAWLVMWRLGLPLDDLDGVAERPVSAEESTQVSALVDERVIIPRSFIAELLADGSIDPWLSEDTRRVLDLCTGNGSLAVLTAMTYPDVQVDAADISLDALAVARINIDRHALSDRIELIESDGLAACPGPYDLIVCNPPYVNAASMAALPAEFRAEPALALAGGEDGMDFIRALFHDAVQHMSENAVLVLEIGNERENFERAFPALTPLWFETSAGSDQVLLLTRQELS